VNQIKFSACKADNFCKDTKSGNQHNATNAVARAEPRTVL